MSEWIVNKKFSEELTLNNPILIGGLPGIGNVGKLAVDYMIDELNPELLFTINSPLFPNSVFINDKNIIELPQVNIYLVRGEQYKRDILLLSGDVQPLEEGPSYKFCNKIMDLVGVLGCKEVLTLGGIGLPASPKNPKIFGAATDEATIERYKKLNKSIIFNKNKAATIVGAAGLLLGLSQLRNWVGVSLLVETIGHRYHLGLKEAKELLKSINSVFSLNINLIPLDKEVKKAEREQANGENSPEGQTFFKSIKRLGGGSNEGDTRYIG